VDGNPGTLQGGTSFATGKVGQAFSFGGAVNQPFGTDFVSVGNPANLQFGTGSFSVEAWVKRGAFPESAFRPIVASYSGLTSGGFIFALEQFTTDGSLRFDFGDGTGVFPIGRIIFNRGSIKDTEFHHVAMVVDRSIQKGKVYVDGVQAGADIDISSIGSVSGSEPITIGKAPNQPHTFFGLIDEVEIYNRALDAGKIKAIFDAGIAGKCKKAPAEATEEVIDALQAIVDSNPGTPLADKVEDAKAQAQTALDELNKEPPDNQAAMGNIEGAVGDLEAAIGLDPAQDPDVTNLTDQLTGVARQLAVEALTQAQAILTCDNPITDPNVVCEAEDALADGDVQRGLGASFFGAFKDAVSLYKVALAKAESA